MGVFCNRGSMERILYAVFFHYNSKGWANYQIVT
jgi:hypothetical protein